MTNLKLEKKLIDQEGTWEIYQFKILVDDVKVGYANIMIDTENNRIAYLEDIEIYEEHRNNGYGTKTINELAEIYGCIYFAPTDEDNQRLYARIAEEWTVDVPEVDQGYGVYILKK